MMGGCSRWAPSPVVEERMAISSSIKSRPPKKKMRSRPPAIRRWIAEAGI